MMIGRIPGATRVLGKSQGYNGLPIRDEMIAERVNGPETPTPDELERLNRGAAVHVRILGSVHPPILVEVGDAPE